MELVMQSLQVWGPGQGAGKGRKQNWRDNGRTPCTPSNSPSDMSLLALCHVIYEAIILGKRDMIHSFTKCFVGLCEQLHAGY